MTQQISMSSQKQSRSSTLIRTYTINNKSSAVQNFRGLLGFVKMQGKFSCFCFNYNTRVSARRSCICTDLARELKWPSYRFNHTNFNSILGYNGLLFGCQFQVWVVTLLSGPIVTRAFQNKRQLLLYWLPQLNSCQLPGLMDHKDPVVSGHVAPPSYEIIQKYHNPKLVGKTFAFC